MLTTNASLTRKSSEWLGCATTVHIARRPKFCTKSMLDVEQHSDYQKRDKALAETLAFLLSDSVRDDSFNQLLQDGIRLYTTGALEALYNGNPLSDVPIVGSLIFLADQSPPSKKHRTIFSSERLWVICEICLFYISHATLGFPMSIRFQ